MGNLGVELYGHLRELIPLPRVGSGRSMQRMTEVKSSVGGKADHRFALFWSPFLSVPEASWRLGCSNVEDENDDNDDDLQGTTVDSGHYPYVLRALGW